MSISRNLSKNVRTTCKTECYAAWKRLCCSRSPAAAVAWSCSSGMAVLSFLPVLFKAITSLSGQFTPLLFMEPSPSFPPPCSGSQLHPRQPHSCCLLPGCPASRLQPPQVLRTPHSHSSKTWHLQSAQPLSAPSLTTAKQDAGVCPKHTLQGRRKRSHPSIRPSLILSAGRHLSVP